MSSRSHTVLLSGLLACGTGPTTPPPVDPLPRLKLTDLRPPCSRATNGPDHLAVVWDGRSCFVEVGSGIQFSSLQLRLELASNVGLSPVRPAVQSTGAELHSCAELSSEWPAEPGSYDVTVRDPVTGHEVTTRLWVKPSAPARELGL